ncbi:MAG: transcription antitermination factor NusB [Planctomycetota bacterium]
MPSPASDNTRSSRPKRAAASANRGPATDGRHAALDAVARQAERFPDLLPVSPETSHLDARDAQFASAIYDATVRRWLTLTAMLNMRLKRPLSKTDPVLRAALLGGAAQLVFMGGVPVHAAIGETVGWAKARSGKSGAGMVNAVLRRIADSLGDVVSEPWDNRRDALPLADGMTRLLADQVFAEDPLVRLMEAASCPRALLRRWTGAVGEEQTRSRAMHGLVRPPVILNTSQHSGELTETAEHAKTGHRVFDGVAGSLSSFLDRYPKVWVQDPSSSGGIESVQELLADDRLGLVIDMCAGIGTKTRQLLAHMAGGRLIATDQEESKLRQLEASPALEGNVETTTLDELPLSFAGQADLVLLDVPCSNTGVLPRRPEARYRAATEQVNRLVDTQRQIVADAIRLLSPRGAILYATCSLEPEENAGISEWACKWHGFARSAERFIEPQGLPGDPASNYWDGAYSVVLKR